MQRTRIVCLCFFALSACGKPDQFPEGATRLDVFDPGGVGHRDAPETAALPPIRALEWGPREAAGAAGQIGQVRVRFNQPVVALAGAAEQAGAWLRVSNESGSLSGTSRFQTPELLVFETAEELPAAHRYVVELASPIEAYDGRSFDDELRWSFETPRPMSALVSPPSRGEMVDGEAPILLATTLPTDVDALRGRVRISANGAPVAWTMRPATTEEAQAYGTGSSEHLFRIDSAKRFPPGAVVTVDVDAGWRSRVGPLPANTKLATSFTIHPPLEVTSMSCEAGDKCDIHPLELHFSTPIPSDQKKYIRVTPTPPQFVIDSFYGDETSEFRLDGRYVPGVKYRIEVDPRLTDTFGQKLGTKFRRDIEFAMPPAELYFETERAQVIDGPTAHLGISSRHVRRIRVRAARVSTAKWLELARADRLRPDKLPPLEQLGEISEHVLDVRPGGKTDWASTPLRLEDVVGSYRGALVVQLAPEEMVRGWASEDVTTGAGIFQFTSLAPHLFASTTRDVVRVEDLQSRAPVGRAAVTLHDARGSHTLGVTDDEGLLETRIETTGQGFLEVSNDDESVVFELTRPPLSATNAWLRPGESLAGAVITERGAYQPGESVHVALWTAIRTPHEPFGFAELPPGAVATVTLIDAAGTELSSAEVELKGGKGWTTLEIPTSARLGSARVDVDVSSAGQTSERAMSRGLAIEEYRVPQFEVRAIAENPEVVAPGKNFVDVAANYYTGGPIDLTNAIAHETCGPTTGPDVEGWQLGIHHYGWGRIRRPTPVSSSTTPGRARLELAASAPPGQPQHCVVTVAVRDRSFQEEGASASYVVHPASWYLGIRQPGPVAAGDDLEVELAAFDLEGKQKSQNATVDVAVTRVIEKPIYEQRGNRQWVSRWEEQEKPLGTCRVELTGKSSCDFRDLVPARYEIVATTTSEGREVRAEYTLHVSESEGAEEADDPFLHLAVEPRFLAPGMPLKIVVETVAPGGLVLIERGGIRQTLPFTTTNGRALLTVGTDASWIAQMGVSAYAIALDDEAPFAELRGVREVVSVDAASRELQVEVSAPTATSIRTATTIDVRVNDANGPVQGRATVWAVDEAVLSLTSYQVPDIQHEFLARYTADVSTADGLVWLLPPFRPERYDPYTSILYGFGSGHGFGGLGTSGRGAGGGGMAAPPRRDFVTTPLFVGDVALVDGEARVTFDTPGNLTSFRIIAVASATVGDIDGPLRYGSGETRLTVSAPIVARPALPRFVRPDDTFSIGVIVQNLSGKKGRLTVNLTADGEAIRLKQQTRMAAFDGTEGQVRVDFDAHASSAGDSTLRARAVFTPDDGSAEIVDDLELPLQSRPEPTVVEHVATYGTLGENGAVGIPVLPPEGARSDYGGVSIEVTSTILGGLRDATRELVHYPYGCVEQTSSRMLPLVALVDLAGFVEAVEIPNGATVASFVDAGVKRILAMQTTSGGFAYWPGAREPNPYASAYATWVLQLAAQAGRPVPDAAMKAALDYLEPITATPDRNWSDDVLYYWDIRRAIATHALAAAGRKPTRAIEELYEQRAQLPAFANGFTALAMHAVDPTDSRLATLRREMLNSITEQPKTASVVESVRYDLGAYFHSDLRASAIVLMALARIARDEDEAVVVKLARGLMDARYRGSWRNTQENAYALVAVAEYARRYEALTPNFAARAWTDHAVLLDDRWQGRSSKAKTGRLPMAELEALSARSDHGVLPINLSKRGDGRAYYRLGMTYALPPETAKSLARGLDVRRTFRRHNGEATPLPDTIRAGDVVAVDIEISTKSLTRYVAVDIPLAAGLEGINLALGGPKVLPMGGQNGWWVSHAEYHDDRIVLFADTLHPGRHFHTVYIRATTPGDFVFPPTVARAMYVPEVFGRTDGGRTRIVD